MTVSSRHKIHVSFSYMFFEKFPKASSLLKELLLWTEKWRHLWLFNNSKLTLSTIICHCIFRRTSLQVSHSKNMLICDGTKLHEGGELFIHRAGTARLTNGISLTMDFLFGRLRAETSRRSSSYFLLLNCAFVASWGPSLYRFERRMRISLSSRSIRSSSALKALTRVSLSFFRRLSISSFSSMM